MKRAVSRFGCATAFAVLLGQTSLAQKLVDPDSVAPQFRAAAEKRRTEQLKLNECTLKANTAKVQIRYRAEYISNCVDGGNHTAN